MAGRLKLLGLCLLCIPLALLAGEFLLRLGGIKNRNFYRFDTLTGHSLIPDFEGEFSEETTQFIKINSHGFRDKPRTIAKADGTFRVAVLGDSFVEALQVPLEKTFTIQLEDRLRRCGAMVGHQIEVLNFGVGGFGTSESLLTLKHKVWRFQPDLVLLLFTPANDILDNLRPIHKKILEPNKFHPQNWLLTHLRRGLESLASVSVVANETLKGAKVLRNLSFSESSSSPSSCQHPLSEDGIKDEIYLRSEDPRWLEGWEVTESLLGRFAAETEAHQVPLMLVTGSSSVQVHPSKKVRTAFKECIGSKDLMLPDRRIKKIARHLNLPVFPLVPRLQSFAQKNQIFLHGFETYPEKGHWNETAHGLVADLLAPWICRSMKRREFARL